MGIFLRIMVESLALEIKTELFSRRYYQAQAEVMCLFGNHFVKVTACVMREVRQND